MLDSIAYWIVKGLNRVLHILPIEVALTLGRSVAWLIYKTSGKRRRITYANLKAVFASKKSPEELLKLTEAVYASWGSTFGELVAMTQVDTDYVEKYVTVSDLERFDEASKNPKGVILVTAHFGNWELATAVSALKGYPLYMLAREQKMKRLNELLNLLRESKGTIVVRKGADIKNMIRMLRAGKKVALAADQSAGPLGMMMDVMGRPASVAPGPYRFAQSTGAWVLPVFMHRTGGRRHHLYIEPIMKIGPDDDIREYGKRYTDLLTDHIYKSPDHWLWMHKRWKLTPLKKVLVLDDGRKGHLNQSLAVVKQIRKYRTDEGYAPEHLEVEIVRVRFKSRFSKTVFNIMKPFFGSNCQGRPGYLRRALDKDSSGELLAKYADVIVSCGSSMAGVNVLMKAENNARNLTVLDPGWPLRDKFDVVVMPGHDATGGGREEATVITELAPNLIDADELDSLARGLEGDDPSLGGKGKTIGLLFGGDNTDFMFDENISRVVGEGLVSVSESAGAALLVTTSRRTPPAAEETLKKAVGRGGTCGMFISGKKDKDENTVQKILALSDVVVVSGESISMVSEAVASGRSVLVFMPVKKTDKKTKYEGFLETLESKGLLGIINAGDMTGEVRKALEATDTRPDVTFDDNQKIYEKLYRLF